MAVAVDRAAEETPEVSRGGRITGRSVALGGLTAAGLCVWTNQTEFVMHSAALVMSNLPMSALIPFIFWTLLNIPVRRWAPDVALTGTELLVILGMGWLVGNVPAIGWTGYWSGIMTAPEYYASPENGWRETFFDVLPKYLFPDPSVVPWFYKGLPPERSLPWGGWLSPLFWWGSVAVAVVGLGLCTAVIFRRQWEEHERLSFPLATIPVALTEGFNAPGRGVPALFRHLGFYAGMAVPVVVMGWNIIGYFNDGFPRIALFDSYSNTTFVFFRQFPPYAFRILPSLIAFTYFCNLDILLSFWLFGFLAMFKIGLMDRFGVTVGLAGQPAKSAEIVGLESHGAMIALVVWSFWVARGHLRDVLRQALGREPQRPGEPMSYRAAVAGFVLCTVFIICWLAAAGQGFVYATVSMAAMFCGYFCLTKYLAASGFAYMFPPDVLGGGFVKTLFGTEVMTARQLTGIQLHNSGAFVGGGRVMGMPQIPHWFRMLGDASGRRWLIPALWIAFFCGVGASFYYVLDLCYTEAGLNLRTYTLTTGNTSTFVALQKALTTANRTVPDPEKMAVWLLGAGEVALLSALRKWLPWWPLHPVGLVFQNTIGIRVFGFSAFIAWLIKLLVLRIGGIGLYRKSQPLFLGLLVGYSAMIGISAIVDWIWFPGQGHWTHGW